MSLSATCESVAQKRTISSLLAGRVLKKPKLGDGQRLQEEAIQLLEQHQDLSSLFKEAGAPDFNIQNGEQRLSVPEGICGSLLLSEVKRQAAQTGVSVPVLSVKLVLGRLEEITEETDGQKQEEDRSRGMFTSCQRVQLRSLLQSSRELLSLGALCPKLLWQEYRRCQKLPKLEVVYYLHSYNIISLKYIIKSDEAVGTWLSSQMKALSEWTPPHTEEETKQVQQKLLSALVGFLVGRGFEQVPDAAAADGTIALLCCSVMDDLLCWVLDIVDKSSTHPSAETGAKLWLGIFDSSLCGVSATEEAVQRFFTHFLTQTLTYKSQLSVSDAISLQHEWTFAKASCCLTALFRKLAVVFSVEQLLGHLQRVLETHEVNWKHVLCFLSTLLVYEQSAQSGLKELLSRLLNSAFQSYELEKMITAFLLARQGVLEGPAIFPSYSDWFKMSFGSSSGYHTNSKKSLVFLLKFLSDLVPFEPPQYLKVHILNPPYVPVKHRSLLMEYVSLAKTRLADLKESVEDMGLYEDVCGAAVQPECQAEQDVEKAVSLFRTTGRISATVMEASIFRRPYFLTRFLPALLKPRLLPVKPDALMSFIEALKKADKIPAALYSSYLESCQKQRQQRKSFVCLDTNDDPLEVVRIQLQDFRELVAGENRGEMSAQLSRIAHTLSVVFPGCPDVKPGSIVLNSDSSQFPDLHLNVVNILLRNFCQCLLNTSRSNPPNKFPSHLFTHSQWASMFVGMMLGNTQLLSCLLNRLWDLFHNQGPVLTSAHVLGLAVFVVHLQASMSHNPLVQLASAAGPELIPFREVLGSALVCSTLPHMLFCVRLCVAAVCFGIVTRDSMPEQQAEFIPSSLYKKLLFLIPRLMPEARGSADGSVSDPESGLWSSVMDGDGSWTEAARRLWRHEAFQELQLLPQYQLRFSEWLHCELRVQRSEDALSDAQRQEYQQWACMDLYLPLPEEQGGCGGDMKKLCSHLLDAVMDHQLRDSSPERIFLQAGAAETGSCLPDLLSRLQELVYEMEVSGGRRLHLSDFLFELLSPRCPPTGASASMSISTELGLQQTLHTWNRVLLSLPAVLFIRVKTEGERTILDMKKLMEHVNQHQRRTCAPSGLLPSHITAHFLKGLMYACVQCKRPGEELDRVWSDMSLHCPLMLVSAAHWWQRLSAVAFSLWRRLSDGESPPQQLQLLTDCQDWACSLVKGHVLQMPSASALLLAASLHRCWQSCEVNRLRAALNSLPHQRDERYKQVLVFLLFLHVNDYLSALLDPEEESPERARVFCSELVSVLVTSADWLLVFTPDEPSIYHSVTLVTSDRVVRLFPWAFCSLMFQENAALLQSAAPCPGFLQTAVLCYISALQLYLDGQTPTAAKQQVESSHILSLTKQFLLSRIPQTPPARLSSSRLRQLESHCADLDPELAAALSMQLDPHSPEMDFL